MTDTDLVRAAEYSRTPVSLPTVPADDPHLQPAARYPERVAGIISIAFLAAIVLFVGFGAAYWVDAKAWVLAVTFGAGLVLLGFGLTAWGKYLMPRGPFVEERHELAGSTEEREAMAAALVGRTGVVLKRRGLLGTLFAAGAGVFSIVLLFPLLRSLGPLPGDTLETTNWRRGSYLVDSTGKRIQVGYVVQGGIVTVFPEGYEDDTQSASQDQTVLIRLNNGPFVIEDAKGNPVDLPTGYVAYSKMCTHLGCPVGLYEQQLEYLVCPCHQSMFDVAKGAIPLFGPAPRPLPMLPLMVDGNGYLQAARGYDQPIGPGFWERTTT